ncbi:MAG: hypothetical protein ACREJC_22345, partial [Tepidisphaeraceae bacterium]
LPTGMRANAVPPWRPLLRVVGSYLYVFTPQVVNAYDLDRPGDGWKSDPEDQTFTLPAQVTRGHMLLLAQPAASASPRRRAQNQFQVLALRRSRVDDAGESGALEFPTTLTEPSGIVQWQAVDGGLYYLSGDQKLHFLRSRG